MVIRRILIGAWVNTINTYCGYGIFRQSICFINISRFLKFLNKCSVILKLTIYVY